MKFVPMVAPVQGNEIKAFQLVKKKRNQTWALYLRLNIKLKGIRERLLAFIANGPQTAALKLNMNAPPVNY